MHRTKTLLPCVAVTSGVVQGLRRYFQPPHYIPADALVYLRIFFAPVIVLFRSSQLSSGERRELNTS